MDQHTVEDFGPSCLEMIPLPRSRDIMQTPVSIWLEVTTKDAPYKDTMSLQLLALAVILSARNGQIIFNLGR